MIVIFEWSRNPEGFTGDVHDDGNVITEVQFTSPADNPFLAWGEVQGQCFPGWGRR